MYKHSCPTALLKSFKKDQDVDFREVDKKRMKTSL